jgi:two-component system response regulator FixJ
MTRLVHIVDDDSEVRASTSFMLRQLGYATEIYGSGDEFLQSRRMDSGSVLLDIRMPGMDGLEVQAELARRGVQLPVIVLTGHGDVELAVRAMKAGAVDFLEKPYKAEELTEAVERAFERAEQNREHQATRTEATAKLNTLTPREREILQGLRAGMANKMIARWLDLSPRTVEVYRAKMMAKLGVTSLSQALRIALDGELEPIDAKAG